MYWLTISESVAKQISGQNKSFLLELLQVLKTYYNADSTAIKTAILTMARNGFGIKEFVRALEGLADHQKLKALLYVDIAGKNTLHYAMHQVQKYHTQSRQSPSTHKYSVAGHPYPLVNETKCSEAENKVRKEMANDWLEKPIVRDTPIPPTTTTTSPQP